MKKDNYKNECVYLGCSDIASLTLRTPDKAGILCFGKDSSYNAWVVRNDRKLIPEHYKKVFECNCWLKIYDDEELTIKFNGETIKIYRAGEHGCLIFIQE